MTTDGLRRSQDVALCLQAGIVLGHGRDDLTDLDHFAEGLAVGIFTNEAWVENVPRVTR